LAEAVALIRQIEAELQSEQSQGKVIELAQIAVGRPACNPFTQAYAEL
jgi:hypothetical protein